MIPAGVGTDQRPAGATVTVAAPRTPDVKVVTDVKGAVYVLAMQPGTYQVRVELDGFKSEQTTVTMASGRTTTIVVVLVVGALTETVSVSAIGSTLRVSTSELALELPASGFNREAYRRRPEAGFHRVSTHPRSTFSTDVDTASYTNVRRMLAHGELPPEGAVRIEAFINYFRFDCATPEGDAPVPITTEVDACPWTRGMCSPSSACAPPTRAGAAVTSAACAAATWCSRSTSRARWTNRTSCRSCARTCARSFAGEDPHEDRAGFVTLAERAAGLIRRARPDPGRDVRR